MTEERSAAQDGYYELLKKLRPGKVVLPVVIGLGVVIWFMTKDLNLNSLKEITFTWKSAFWLTAAIFFLVLRTFAYMARIRVLTNNELTWIQTFRIIILWEFTSAITPSTVGGTAFAVIFLHKEGINVGRSTAVVLVTSFLDELYFVIMFPLLIILMGWNSIFITSFHSVSNVVMNHLFLIATIGYIIILVWVLLIGYGLFFKPEVIKKTIVSIFKFPILRRWNTSAEKTGNDIIFSSIELKKKSSQFWFNALFHTFVAWTSRYLLVNAILVSFFTIKDHLLIFTRQLILWIMMILSPTPGGSGFAEIILGRYLSDLIPVDDVHAHGVSLAMALIWRVISYYPFLIAGVLILPVWVRRKFMKPVTKK